MSRRLHRFTLLLVCSLCASFRCDSDEEEADALFSTSPAHQEARSPQHLCETLNQKSRLRGCSCLRHSPGNIWGRSTVVFRPLRTALMRKFLVSHERRSRMHFLSKKKKGKKREHSGLSRDLIIWSSSSRLKLVFDHQPCFRFSLIYVL